jgi:hypothetical protein
MDQLPVLTATQPEILGVHTPHPASNAMAQLAAIEGSLVNMQSMLKHLLHNNENLLPALAPTVLALASGPDFSALLPSSKVHHLAEPLGHL